jgi:hypothetical protein
MGNAGRQGRGLANRIRAGMAATKSWWTVVASVSSYCSICTEKGYVDGTFGPSHQDSASEILLRDHQAVMRLTQQSASLDILYVPSCTVSREDLALKYDKFTCESAHELDPNSLLLTLETSLPLFPAQSPISSPILQSPPLVPLSSRGSAARQTAHVLTRLS